MQNEKEWLERFTEQVKAIQIEFDGFLKNKPLSGYYDFHRDENGQLISLHFMEAHALPREIEQALTKAFLAAKPKR